MGYAVYEDASARDYGVTRWAGYGVPAVCDFPGCDTRIMRGTAFLCEKIVDGPDGGCNMFFCTDHLYDHAAHQYSIPKPDTEEWTDWMLTDESWSEWRANNQADAIRLGTRGF